MCREWRCLTSSSRPLLACTACMPAAGHFPCTAAGQARPTHRVRAVCEHTSSGAWHAPSCCPPRPGLPGRAVPFVAPQGNLADLPAPSLPCPPPPGGLCVCHHPREEHEPAHAGGGGLPHGALLGLAGRQHPPARPRHVQLRLHRGAAGAPLGGGGGCAQPLGMLPPHVLRRSCKGGSRQ